MKTILMKNINNKLGCDAFVHIDIAPKEAPSIFNLPVRVLIQEPGDGEGTAGLKFEADVVDLFMIDNIQFVPGVFTYCGHGVDSVQYYKDLAAKDADCLKRKYCVYYYKKVKKEILNTNS